MELNPPRIVSALVSVILAATLAKSNIESFRTAEREHMVLAQIESRGIRDPRVLQALRSVPRHRFVPPRWQPQAYDDSPLPIGEGQTISQPFMVAHMTEILGLKPTDHVFELGTGSGYQAAVASRLVAHVWSMELHESLASRARQVLAELAYDNVTVRTGDGYYGWPKHAPFDAIFVTAAATHIPPPLIRQLKPGGRMIVPIGPAFSTQRLMLVEKTGSGRLSTRALFPVRFVPLLRGGEVE